MRESTARHTGTTTGLVYFNKNKRHPLREIKTIDGVGNTSRHAERNVGLLDNEKEGMSSRVGGADLRLLRVCFEKSLKLYSYFVDKIC